MLTRNTLQNYNYLAKRERVQEALAPSTEHESLAAIRETTSLVHEL